MNQPTGVHHVALTVTDLEASAGWYRRVLGLEEAFTEQSERRGAIVLSFAGGPSIVGLVQHGDGAGSRFDPAVVGLDHVALSVGSRADLDAWTARLDDENVPHSGVIDVPPGAILNFKDPDGIALAFFWDR